MTRGVAVVAGVLLAGGALHAQQRQAFSVERTTLPTNNLSVIVRHDIGQFSIQPASDSVRYRATLRYDARAVEPIYRYAADSGSLRIGTRERQGRRGSDASRRSELELALGSTGVLAIDVRAGAAESDLNLGGLPITTLAVSSGASDMRVRFDRPNPVRMKNMTLSTGAASVVADQLGNANVETMLVRASVGEMHLDFSGTWSGETELRTEVTLGTVTIHVPVDVGVYVEPSRVLAGFSHEGLKNRGAAWVSDNWESAPRKLRVYAQTLFGYLTIDRR
ncbi:MAG: LiaF domain-containing protein [Gemmatimonadota bacterium]